MAGTTWLISQTTNSTTKTVELNSGDFLRSLERNIANSYLLLSQTQRRRKRKRRKRRKKGKKSQLFGIVEFAHLKTLFRMVFVRSVDKEGDLILEI